MSSALSNLRITISLKNCRLILNKIIWQLITVLKLILRSQYVCVSLILVALIRRKHKFNMPLKRMVFRIILFGRLGYLTFLTPVKYLRKTGFLIKNQALARYPWQTFYQFLTKISLSIPMLHYWTIRRTPPSRGESLRRDLYRPIRKLVTSYDRSQFQYVGPKGYKIMK